MNTARTAFLEYVQKYVEQDPYVAAYVADYVHKGLTTVLNTAYERAADMETALAVLSAKRFKNRNETIIQKLEKWEGKTALCWDWLLKELKDDQTKRKPKE